MRRRRLAHMEEDSLQADVMRFMAIVAFCLIAILAMVRNSPQTETDMQADVETRVEAIVETTVMQQADTQPAGKENPDPASVEPETFKQVRVAPTVNTVAEPKYATVAELTRPVLEAQIESTREPEPEPLPEPESQPESPAVHSETAEGLTLAFASEADFMRLISKGRITLYAYAGQSFLSTSDTYSFFSTDAPTQLYEIDERTIPPHVLTAADRQEVQYPQGGGELKWGVGLSPRIEKQISRYVEANVSGQLHIDRYEQVLHVEAG